MALSKFCPNLLLTLWNQNETMWVSRFFCRALDGCLLIKAILLLLPYEGLHIVNIVVKVMVMMVWMVEKKALRFPSKLAHLYFKINKCAEFSSFLILLKKCGKKSDSSLKLQKNFTKDFLGIFFPKGILYKMNTDQN